MRFLFSKEEAVIKCVQIPAKESVKMNTSNLTNYKTKDFTGFLGVSVKI